MLTIRRLAITLLLIAVLMSIIPFSIATGAVNFVTGTLYIDKNLNGLMDTDEMGISDIKISLMQEETEIESLRTNEDGSFSFANVTSGEYSLQTSLPENFIPTRYKSGGSELIPSPAGTSKTPPFQIISGISHSILLGAINEASGSFIRVIAFGDDNLNGGRFSSEPALRGVKVELLKEIDGQLYAVQFGETDRDGALTMSRIAPGEYMLAAEMTGDYVIGPLGLKLSTFYNTILPGHDNYGRSAPFILPEKGSLGLGIGGALTGSGAGMVWDDLNFNGLKEDQEPGLAGVEFNLRHQSMGVERVILSQEDGSFTFPTLQPGDYTLTATLPNHLMFTISGGESIFWADDSRSQSKTVSVQAEKKANFGAVGAIPNTSLQVQAFHDSNVNGLADEGEPVFAGAELTVLKDNKRVASAISDSEGIARIPILRGGNYDFQLSLPDGQIFSIDGGEDGNRFFSASASSMVTINYTLPPAINTKLMAGTTLPSLISGTLFVDKNNNGVFEQGEEFQSGFTVQALDSEGYTAAQTLTDGEGAYELPELIPGSYNVRILLKSPYIFSGMPTANGELSNRFTSQTALWGQTDIISLQAGQVANHIDGAIFRSAVIEGDVLLGDETDGFSGEIGGLEGVFIQLLDEDAKPVSDYTVATTDAKGHYLLKGALPGTYSLRYRLPSGAAFSQPLTDEYIFTSSQFDIHASDELLAKTLFAVTTGSLSGKIYIDSNINGLFDEKDKPLSGISLNITSDIPGRNKEVQSEIDGSYILSLLRPGNYQLLLSLPGDLLFSFDESSPFDPAISSGSNANIDISMGMHISNQMIAALPSHSLSGRVFYDNNLSGEADDGEPGLDQLELRFRHELSRIEFKAISDENGRYTIPTLFPGLYSVVLSLPEDHMLYSPAGSVSNTGTWESKVDLHPELSASVFDLGLVQFGSVTGEVYNLDGSQQAVDGLLLTLQKSPGGEEIAKTTSDAAGFYQFSKLYPGQYLLKMTLPEDYRFVRTIDSEMARFSRITSDQSTMICNDGISAPFSLLMAENKLAQDVGICTLAEIGDLAWLDLDGDGMQDTAEPGLPGIQIRLFQYNTEVASVKTDAYGRYHLRDLYPGLYTIEITIFEELKATMRQTEFPLVASILPQVEGGVIRVEDVLIKSGTRNLNIDMGFELIKEGILTPWMQNLPKKDWTPYTQLKP